jgi:hypothetical protein
LLKNCLREACGREKKLRFTIADASGSGFGFGGVNSNEKMVAKLIADTLQAQNFSGILPQGVASLIGVLSKAVT